LPLVVLYSGDDVQEQTLAEITKALSIEELRQFAKETAPCVTVLAPSHVPGGPGKKLTSRLKKLIHAAEQKLSDRGYECGAIGVVIEPLANQITKIVDETGVKAEGLALFGSPGEARMFWLPRPQNEMVTAGDNYYIRPLIPLLNRDKEFYILAVAQKHVRLLRCTEFTSEEVPLPKETPKTLLEDAGTDQPDHMLDNRASAGPSEGVGTGVMFSTSTDREARDQYLAHWFKDLSRGVAHVIGEAKTPLILCSVEYEQAIYREVNTYPHLLEEGVAGAPDSFKGGELHKRALEALQRYDEQKVDDAMRRWNKQGGWAATMGVKDIVRAGYEGRVMTLLIAETAQVMGNFNEASFSAEGTRELKPWDEDLLNAAALQTIVHGGQVFVVPQSRIPENRPMAAIVRY
jgi:hypothetical protein